MVNKLNTYNKLDANALAHGRGCVYSLMYHIVWATKYRRPILVDGVDDICKDLLREAMAVCKTDIMSIEVMPDHIHILVSASPQVSVPNIVRIAKGSVARRLFIMRPDLKRALWGGHLWNPSYCAVTVSDRTEEQIRHYIENQKTK